MGWDASFLRKSRMRNPVLAYWHATASLNIRTATKYDRCLFPVGVEIIFLSEESWITFSKKCLTIIQNALYIALFAAKVCVKHYLVYFLFTCSMSKMYEIVFRTCMILNILVLSTLCFLTSIAGTIKPRTNIFSFSNIFNKSSQSTYIVYLKKQD